MTECPEDDKSPSYFSSCQLLESPENKVFSKHRSIQKTSMTFSGSVPHWNSPVSALHTHKCEQHPMCVWEADEDRKTPEWCPIYMT